MIGCCLVFSFIHRPIHARLEKRLRCIVRPNCHELEELVDIAFHITPHERRLAFGLTSPEL